MKPNRTFFVKQRMRNEIIDSTLRIKVIRSYRMGWLRPDAHAHPNGPYERDFWVPRGPVVFDVTYYAHMNHIWQYGRGDWKRSTTFVYDSNATDDIVIRSMERDIASLLDSTWFGNSTDEMDREYMLSTFRYCNLDWRRDRGITQPVQGDYVDGVTL